jgi:hypothetical protein
MRVNVFLRSAGEGIEARRKRDVLRHFHQGLRAEREDAHLVSRRGYEPCDVAVVLGGRPSAKRAATRNVRDEIFARHDGVFVHLETPLFGRSVYQRAPIAAYVRKLLRLGRNRYSDEYGYYRVAANGFVQDDADFNNAASPPDRWLRMSEELGLKLKPYRRQGGHVLIIGQNPGDASLRGIDIFQWMHETVVEARRLTNRPIIVRPHPVTPPVLMRQFEQRFSTLPGIVIDYPPTRPVRAVLQDCWVLLAYSSSATIDALIEGVPCITSSPANMAWPVSDHTLERIDQPTLYPREQWLADLAYAQWSPEEMRSGLTWRQLRSAVLRAFQPSDGTPAACAVQLPGLV